MAARPRFPEKKHWLLLFQARNTNIIEDLGRVAYVFSDKTGTLTSNEMRLRAVSVKGIPYGSADFRCCCWHSTVLSTCCLAANERLVAAAC
jgi:magnesium-transporting ATPase (P-type)